jgi:hypothetical protein
MAAYTSAAAKIRSDASFASLFTFNASTGAITPGGFTAGWKLYAQDTTNSYYWVPNGTALKLAGLNCTVIERTIDSTLLAGILVDLQATGNFDKSGAAGPSQGALAAASTATKLGYVVNSGLAKIPVASTIAIAPGDKISSDAAGRASTFSSLAVAVSVDTASRTGVVDGSVTVLARLLPSG